MLDDLDAIAWGDLTHAYGSAHDIPGLLRQAGSDDDAAASEAVSELHGKIFHQGTVYPRHGGCGAVPRGACRGGRTSP